MLNGNLAFGVSLYSVPVTPNLSLSVGLTYNSKVWELSDHDGVAGDPVKLAAQGGAGWASEIRPGRIFSKEDAGPRKSRRGSMKITSVRFTWTHHLASGRRTPVRRGSFLKTLITRNGNNTTRGCGTQMGRRTRSTTKFRLQPSRRQRSGSGQQRAGI